MLAEPFTAHGRELDPGLYNIDVKIFNDSDLLRASRCMDICKEVEKELEEFERTLKEEATTEEMTDSDSEESSSESDEENNAN